MLFPGLKVTCHMYHDFMTSSTKGYEEQREVKTAVKIKRKKKFVYGQGPSCMLIYVDAYCFCVFFGYGPMPSVGTLPNPPSINDSTYIAPYPA